MADHLTRQDPNAHTVTAQVEVGGTKCPNSCNKTYVCVLFATRHLLPASTHRPKSWVLALRMEQRPQASREREEKKKTTSNGGNERISLDVLEPRT